MEWAQLEGGARLIEVSHCFRVDTGPESSTVCQ